MVDKIHNPLLGNWAGPDDVPPFGQFSVEDFAPAFDAAFEAHSAEVAEIAAQKEAPNFDNTIVTLERSGRALDQVSDIFFNLTSSDTSDALQAIERDVAPRFSKHMSAIYLNDKMFARVDALMGLKDSLGLTSEQARVLERYHTLFVRAGAQVDSSSKQRLAEISERLSSLGTQFAQNLLADETAFMLVLESEEDMAGLPRFMRAAAAQCAEERGLAGKHVITLARSSVEPFLQFSSRRDLRQRAFEAWARRGEQDGDSDNRGIIAETLALRAERATYLGFDSYAHFKLDDAMAGTPDAVRELLMTLWAPAKERAGEERDALQEIAQSEGENFQIAPWDWRYYAEKLRKLKHDLEESELKPYLQLERMIEAAFDTAGRLFGLRFTERHDIPLYHPDVRIWEVAHESGQKIGLFCGDYFARSSKHSGAWMSEFRTQRKLDGDVRPIVVNVMNFSKGAAGEPALLSFDDTRTLFHEFGHALHGLLSDVTYPLIAGTNVARDFVELPSQLYEHWVMQPEVLKRFAVHSDTGKAMPEKLLERVIAAQKFNQGFATVEFLASAIVDLDLHLQPPDEQFDIGEFEGDVLARIGMPGEIVMRHRPTQFGHVFSGEGYASGYYSYLWSEVMDADAFKAFEEAGDIFDKETAARLYAHIYSAGGRQDPAEAYEAFRGRSPTIDALLEKRGFGTS